MDNLKNNAEGWKGRVNKTVWRLGLWTGAWVITMALAVFGPEFLWEANQLLTVIAILVNLALGLGMIWANIRHLDVLDEMMQKIQLQAMGFALGIGVVGGLSYSLLDVTNIIATDAEIAHLVMLMAITYLVAMFINHRRYR